MSGLDESRASSASAGDASDYSLQIDQQPPQHAFVDEWFNVEVTLGGADPRQSPALLLGGGLLRLRADLYVHEGGMVRDRAGPDVAQLSVDPSTPLAISLDQPMTKYSTTVRCKLSATLSNDSSVSVCINFSSVDHIGGTSSVNIQGASTQPIQLVSYKLSIEPLNWEKVWYKDEGGRDKCMQVQVGLCDKDDSPVYNIRVPLTLELRYADAHVPVQKQDLLRVLGPPKQFIDPESSRTTLRFRIEDVSKNHQGQDFQVEVSADLSKFAGVAPASTPSVSVRSKRNKRQRGQSEAASFEVDRPTSSRHPFHRDMPMPSHMSSQPGHPMPPSYRGTAHPSVAQDRPQGLAGVADVQRLRDAMQGVIRWTDEVVNGLYPLQWQIIGYAPFPDGTVDYNHPYHSMPNPNSCITRVLSMYSSSTREDLRVLMNAVENTISLQRPDLGGVEIGDAAAAAGHEFAGAARPSSVDHARLVQMERGRVYEQYSEKPPYAHGSGPPTPQMTRVGYGHAEAAQAAHFSASHPGSAMLHSQQQQVGAKPMKAAAVQQGLTPAEASGGLQPVQEDTAESAEALQAQVAYVLAKQYKALRTGERLGFPAFNAAKDIIGFYQESSTKVGVERFVPISRLDDDFGPIEKEQARQILLNAIQTKSEAVHSIKDWGSVTNLLDNALVYDWSKKMMNTSGSGSPSFP